MAFTTSQRVQGGGSTVNVRAYKASRFSPYPGQSPFPGSGAAPASPDVADAPASAPGYVSVTLPTNEPYIVAFVDNQSRITGTAVVHYIPTSVGGLIIGSGAGAPAATVGTPLGSMLYVQNDGAAGSRLWMYTTATGWIAVAGF